MQSSKRASIKFIANGLEAVAEAEAEARRHSMVVRQLDVGEQRIDFILRIRELRFVYARAVEMRRELMHEIEHVAAQEIAAAETDPR